jgi:hypothetical protein
VTGGCRNAIISITHGGLRLDQMALPLALSHSLGEQLPLSTSAGFRDQIVWGGHGKLETLFSRPGSDRSCYGIFVCFSIHIHSWETATYLESILLHINGIDCYWLSGIPDSVSVATNAS